MSIYGSGLVAFDADDHTQDCAVWVRCSRDEAQGAPQFILFDDHGLRYDDTRDCTCRCGPIRYRSSHVLPSDEDDRSGSMSLCTIAGWIGAPDRPALSDDLHPYWPWLRMTASDEVSTVTLVLDAKQARHMRDQLTFWLEYLAIANGGEGRG